jgi:hypothetical protein
MSSTIIHIINIFLLERRETSERLDQGSKRKKRREVLFLK